jgi:hypothetical protein
MEKSYKLKIRNSLSCNAQRAEPILSIIRALKK